MSVVLGLDPGSANPGLAAIVKCGSKWHVEHLPVLKSLDALAHALEELESAYGSKITICAYESIAWSGWRKKQGHGSGRIVESIGMLRLTASRVGAKLVEVWPNQWRKTIAGSAKATKKQVRQVLYQRVTGVPTGCGLNRSDAIAIAITGAIGARTR